MKENKVIGIVGGMGSFATLDFFRRVLLHYPAEKEWERPRVLIDNYCTMPSRVRAILYNEKYEEVVSTLKSAIQGLVGLGATDVILACNTSHYFLKDIYKEEPGLKAYVVNIIDACVDRIVEEDEREVYLIASEGTVDTRIYENALAARGIKVINPTAEEQVLIRSFIEAVKCDRVDKKEAERFQSYFNSLPTQYVILGCTEIPILYARMLGEGLPAFKTAIDPLQCALEELDKR